LSEGQVFRHRSIRSFVRREGRITDGQRRALGSLSPGYCIEPGEGMLDLDALFGRHAPRYLEIGYGAGETLAALARQHPDNDYLGIEVYRPGLGRLLQRLAAEELSNTRLLCQDAVVALERLEEASLDGIYIFFPDPWPKKRHRKRRLIQPEFTRVLRKALKSHGRVFIATDWEDYAEHILTAMEDSGFTNLAGQGHFAPRPRWRPVTRFEQRAMKENRRASDLVFTPG
jgi:tRNA (guanine-N7-)-methyltransferase